MNENIINTGILAGSFLVLFALAEIMYHYMHIKVELTRKTVHFGTGILTLLFPVMLHNHWLVLFLCSSFALILIVSLKFNLLKSINAIDRKSAGSICYPVSVYLCYLVYEHYGYAYYFFYLPILTLAICDPIAALCGKTWPLGKYKVGNDHKTLMGSSMFFLSSFILSVFLVLYSGGFSFGISLILLCFIFAALTTFVEAISKNGYDNISIPIMSLIILIIEKSI